MDPRDLDEALRAAGLKPSGEVFCEPVESHPDFPGWDAELTPGQVVAEMGERAEALDRGEFGYVEPVERFALEMYPDYKAKNAERAKLAEEARNAGVPEPPPVKVPAGAYKARARKVLKIRALQREDAKKVRIEARTVAERASLSRHHARVRAATGSIATRRGLSRERAHAPRRRRRAAVPKSGGDPPGSREGDGEPHRPPHLLLHDLELHLAHVGALGVERDWFETQVASMGHAIERVRAAIALAISLGQVRAEVTADGDHVLYAVFGGRS